MARKDTDAADFLRRLMIDRGLSAPDLSQGIKAKMVKAGFSVRKAKVSDDEIYLILRTGHQPGPRIKFAIANYFDLRPGQVWADDAVFDDAAAPVAAEPVAA